jgi:uncharacterized membrane protein YdjX (TVP38/TMEM64 family)
MNSGIQKALLVVTGVAVVIGLIWYFGLHNYFTLAVLRENRAYFELAVQKNYWQSVIKFILIYTAVISLLIPGVPPLTIIGGFLFGFLPGVIYSGIAAAGGATIAFLVIRYVLSNVIRGKYAQKLERFNEKISSQGAATYLLTMQLIGIIPYFIIITLAALTNVSTITFFWTTFVGSLPTICVYAFAGRQLSSLESVQDIFSPSIIAMFVALALFAIVFPLLIKRFRKDKD